MIIDQLNELSEIANKLSRDRKAIQSIQQIADLIIDGYRAGNKVLFCGNGGSAAQAQHLAAELSGKFYIDRKPIPAEACHVNSSFLTAVSNDYEFSKTYARYVEASGEKGDILLGLSTSGNSKNIIEAFKTAKGLGMVTVALTGKSGGKLINLSDYVICIPSENIPRIQEAHLMIGHTICEIVENSLFGK